MDTVSYGMPPEGYDTVTLPTELVEMIDETTHMGRQATLRHLLSEYHSDANGDIADGVRDQLDRIESAAKEATNAAQNAERAAEGLGGQR